MRAGSAEPSRNVGVLISTVRARVLLAGCVLAAVAACSSGASGYGNDTRGAFMESCAVKQQQPEAICRCTYDEITQQIPFDRYVELDQQLQKDPKAVPDELLRIVADCASRVDTGSSSPSMGSSAGSS